MTIEHRLFIIVIVFSCQPDGVFSQLFDLSGQLVAGAAAGFGEVICARFPEFGCDITAGGRDYDGVKRTADKLAALGRRPVAIPVDVGNPKQIQTM